jgi:hypothetical protein
MMTIVLVEKLVIKMALPTLTIMREKITGSDNPISGIFPFSLTWFFNYTK